MHVSPLILSIIMVVTLITSAMNTENIKAEYQSLYQQDISIRQSRLGHRLQLIFPLMLSVANRLGALVSMMIIGLGGIIALVTFSKLAFLTSLGTLALVIHERFVTKQKPEMYFLPSATSSNTFSNLFPTNMKNSIFKKYAYK